MSATLQDEAVAVAVGLRVAGGGPTVDVEVLTAIAGASHNRERLRFEYVDHDGESSLRIVEPHRLVYTGRRWYLLAWDTAREDWRTFRADRIRPRLPTGPRFAPREMLAEDAAARIVRGTGSRAWPQQATVRLHAPVHQVAEKITPAAGLLAAVDETTCLLETGGPSLRDLAGFLGSLDVAFTVLDPPELRDELRKLADRCAAAAEPPSAG
ncbi:MAG: helix-turn-helix transcriptional regulator [Jiangellaceae bacterium]